MIVDEQLVAGDCWSRLDWRAKSVFPDDVCWQTFHNDQERLEIVRERLSRYPNESIRNLP